MCVRANVYDLVPFPLTLLVASLPAVAMSAKSKKTEERNISETLLVADPDRFFFLFWSKRCHIPSCENPMTVEMCLAVHFQITSF